MIRPLRKILLGGLAVFFIAAGLNHFRDPATYLGMMPPWLSRPDLANFISGAAEVLGGAGLFVPKMRKWAGWGLILLLLAIFPANLHVAVQGHMPGHDFSRTLLWWRLPFQPLLVALVWWVAIRDRRSAGKPDHPSNAL